MSNRDKKIHYKVGMSVEEILADWDYLAPRPGI